MRKAPPAGASEDGLWHLDAVWSTVHSIIIQGMRSAAVLRPPQRKDVVEQIHSM